MKILDIAIKVYGFIEFLWHLLVKPFGDISSVQFLGIETLTFRAKGDQAIKLNTFFYEKF